jgi:hypothetical protein
VLLLIAADGKPIVGNLDEVPSEVTDSGAWRVYKLSDDRSLRAVVTTLRDGAKLLVGETGDGHGDAPVDHRPRPSRCSRCSRSVSRRPGDSTVT